jgi:ribonuclease Z
MYIVDAGAGSAAVLALGGMPMQNLRGVLLTHYHSDHISALADIGLNAWVTGRSAPLEVIGPEGVESVVAGFNQAYALDRSYRVAHHGADLLPPAGGLLAARTIDAGRGRRQGLRRLHLRRRPRPVQPAGIASLPGRSVVVSGDTIVTDALAGRRKRRSARRRIVGADRERAVADGGCRCRMAARILRHHGLSRAYRRAAGAGRGCPQLAFYHLVPPSERAAERIFMRDVPRDVVLPRTAWSSSCPSARRRSS